MHVSRRHFLGSAVAAISIPTAAKADIMCTPFNGQGIQMCEVGLNVPTRTARQRRQNWCWAACIQAIFSFHGHNVDQAEIVSKVFGSAEDIPASGPQIVYGVQGDWIDNDGNEFSAEAEVLWDTQYFFGRPDAAGQAAQELASDNPLIVGALGHATVLTAMRYYVDLRSAGVPLQLTVRDPWPGNPNRRLLSGPEVLSTQFLAKIAVS